MPAETDSTQPPASTPSASTQPDHVASHALSSVLFIAIKDLKLISRDWLGMFFIVVFPVLMGLFFGSIMGNFGSGSSQLSVAIVDEDQSETSKRFVELLEETGNIEVRREQREPAMRLVRTGKLVGLIVMPEGFGELAGMPWGGSPEIEIGIDPSRKAEAGMLQGLVMQSMGRMFSDRLRDPDAMRRTVERARQELARTEDLSPEMARDLTQMIDRLDGFVDAFSELNTADGSQDSDEPVDGSGEREDSGMPEMQLARVKQIDVTRELAKDSPAALVRKIRSRWDISFPQAMMWGILACAAGFAVTIVRERTQGTLLRLQVAPINWAQILGGKALACGLAMVLVIAFMIGLGMLLGMRPRSPGLLVLSTLCIAACFVGIMMLTAVIGRTEEAVSGAGWGAYMVMAMFGGGMIPLAFMPGFMKTMSHFSPVKWSVLSMEGAIWRGFTLSEMILPCAILLVIGAVCGTLGVLKLSRSER